MGSRRRGRGLRSSSMVRPSPCGCAAASAGVAVCGSARVASPVNDRRRFGCAGGGAAGLAVVMETLRAGGTTGGGWELTPVGAGAREAGDWLGPAPGRAPWRGPRPGGTHVGRRLPRTGGPRRAIGRSDGGARPDAGAGFATPGCGG